MGREALPNKSTGAQQYRYADDTDDHDANTECQNYAVEAAPSQSVVCRCTHEESTVTVAVTNATDATCLVPCGALGRLVGGSLRAIYRIGQSGQ